MAEMMTLRELYDHCKDGLHYKCACGASAFIQDDCILGSVSHALRTDEASRERLTYLFAALYRSHTPSLIGTGKCSCGRPEIWHVPGLHAEVGGS